MLSEHDLIVVGAGLSGLLAARHLKENVKNVLVLDKGRGVGGRLSRRRFDGGVSIMGPSTSRYALRFFESRSISG